MIDLATVYTNVTGAFPNVTAQNATGAGLTDGTEFIKSGLDNGPEFGFQQAIMDYAGGSTNIPTGMVGTPNGVSDGAGVSQTIQAIEKGFAVGPGKYVQWGLFDDPSVTLDRVLLLSNQGVLIATYPELVDRTYVGDGNNPTAPFFYKSVLADGLTRDTAGPFFILPPANPTYRTQYSEVNGDFTVTGTNWTTDKAFAFPYQTSDGQWNINGHISGIFSIPTAVPSLTMSGITSKTLGTSNFQATEMSTTTGASNRQISHIGSATNVFLGVWSTAITRVFITFDIALDSEPGFVNGHTFPWGIAY